MKKFAVIGVALLGLAGGVAACGNEEVVTEASKTQQPAPGPEPAPAQEDTDGDGIINNMDGDPYSPDSADEPTSEPEPEADDCNELGINPEGLNEGACVDDGGNKVKVVNRDHKLMLDEVGVRVLSIGATETIEVPYDTPLTGSFVVATVEVTNRMDAPVEIDASEMFELGLEGKTFTADFDAMNTGSDDGLIYEPIQPDQTVTGSVVFRVAPKRIDGLEKDGNFVVYQFSDVDSFDQPVKRVGIVRTYN